jgi:hypothetical protein
MGAAGKHSAEDIRLIDESPTFDGAELRMRFRIERDGQPVLCEITAEALEDHFGAESALEEDLRKAFERGRSRILTACAVAIGQTGGSVVLHSGAFRVLDE